MTGFSAFSYDFTEVDPDPFGGYDGNGIPAKKSL